MLMICLASPTPPRLSLPPFIIRACRLQSLASAVMTLVDAIVKTSQGQLKQSSSVLQEIMTAAADERGEWHVPLTSQQLESMSQVGAGWGAHCFALLSATTLVAEDFCCCVLCSAHAGRSVSAGAPLLASGRPMQKHSKHWQPGQPGGQTVSSSAGPAHFRLGRTSPVFCGACCEVLAVGWLDDLASSSRHLKQLMEG